MSSNWVMVLCAVGFTSAWCFWEADLLWFEQGFIFGVLIAAGVWGWLKASPHKLHPLYLRNNAGIGLVRAAFWAAMIWCTFTVFFFGDSTITGLWHLWYLIMAYGVIKIFGILGAQFLGVRLRVDVLERGNFAAAMFIAAFVFSTGLIAGGSMWGESTPESMEFGAFFEILPSYDDGSWIIAWFFLMGWLVLFLTMKLWFIREKAVSSSGIRRDRDEADAKAASLYCLACAIPITDAVAGDYYGLQDSFLGFAVIAIPVLAHEFLRPSSAEAPRDPQEPWLYIAFGLVAMMSSTILSIMLGFR